MTTTLIPFSGKKIDRKSGDILRNRKEVAEMLELPSDTDWETIILTYLLMRHCQWQLGAHTPLLNMWETVWRTVWRDYMLLSKTVSLHDIKRVAIERGLYKATGPFHNMFQSNLLAGIGWPVDKANQDQGFQEALKTIRGKYETMHNNLCW